MTTVVATSPTLAILALVIGILAVGIGYGTDVFATIAMRPAGAIAKPASIADLMGHIHRFADKRLPVPSIIGMVASLIAVIFVAPAVGRIAAIVALIAQVLWTVIYARVAAPINKTLSEAAVAGTIPDDTAALQARWNSVMWARAILQFVAMLGLVVALVFA